MAPAREANSASGPFTPHSNSAIPTHRRLHYKQILQVGRSTLTGIPPPLRKGACTRSKFPKRAARPRREIPIRGAPDTFSSHTLPQSSSSLTPQSEFVWNNASEVGVSASVTGVIAGVTVAVAVWGLLRLEASGVGREKGFVS